MIGKTNVLYGANGPGNPESDMRLLVTFPKGSVCTCTNGTMTMRALNTLGACVFYIPSTGDWTVSATDGTDNLSATVSMTAGLKKSIKLAESITRKYLRNALTSYDNETVSKITDYAFAYQTNLEYVKTGATSIGNGAFNNCSSLKLIDFTSNSSGIINLNILDGVNKINSIIFRSATPWSIYSIDTLLKWPMLVGEGRIFVPDDAIDAYRAETNWCDLPLEKLSKYPLSTFETISDAWEEIFASETNGTYASKYSPGDTKYMEYNGYSFLAEIVAIDTDTLTSGGTAKITWITKPGFIMRAYDSSSNDVGWGSCELRTYLQETVLPAFPTILKNNIKSVVKTYYDHSSASALSSNDMLWIPSYREMTGLSTYETTGADYSTYFGAGSGTSYKRRKGWYTLGYSGAIQYGLRTKILDSSFLSIESVRGGASAHLSQIGTSNRFAVGFCT